MEPQHSQAWYEARLGKATASQFDKVMAKSTTEAYRGYKTELIMERLYGLAAPHLQDKYVNKNMEWGTQQEPLARLTYMLRTGYKVKETGFHKHKSLMAGAAPDGLIGAQKGLEIKCPTTANHLYALRTKKVPSKYISQVQGQMFICGFESVDFVSFDPRLPSNAQFIIIPVKRDPAYIELLEEKLKVFLAEVDDDLAFITNYGKEPNALQSPSPSRAKKGSGISGLPAKKS